MNKEIQLSYGEQFPEFITCTSQNNIEQAFYEIFIAKNLRGLQPTQKSR